MAWIQQKKKTDEETQQVEETKEVLKKPTLPSFKKNEVVKERIMVVKELPLRPIREYEDEDGTLIHLMTIEEALTEIMKE